MSADELSYLSLVEVGRRIQTRQLSSVDVTQAALDLLTSSQVSRALDVEKEDVKLRDRYGRGNRKPASKEGDGAGEKPTKDKPAGDTTTGEKKTSADAG